MGAFALFSACAPIVTRHGFVPSETELAQFVPGQTTRDQVLEVLPAPTTSGATGQGNLYYVYSMFRTLGPFDPKEVDRQIVAINVNAAGIVTGITRYGLADGRVVPLSQRVTADNVADVSFLKQLMGNFGRIDAGSFLKR